MNRIPPAEALPDVVERIVSRRQLVPEDGDVLITRERVPRLNPYAHYPQPWRYRVTVRGSTRDAQLFTSFAHAASAAEQLASEQKVRVLYNEDDSQTVLGDYRR